MKKLKIAVGIIRSEQSIFLTQRTDSLYMANKWEFPGGKIKIGENPVQTLKRELKEETSIEVLNAREYAIVDHTYDDDLHVTLHCFLVEQWKGDPYGHEGQSSRWVAQTDLQVTEFPPANAELVARLHAEVCQETK